ncbi:MAG: hypothetical protein ACI35T_01780 [Alistipes sp.]
MSIITDLKNCDNNPKSGCVKFVSSDHIRYQNGVNMSGHNYGCHRSIHIEKNINQGEGYTVSIYNLDAPHPLWGNNIQMAPKQMRVISCIQDEITLRGFGYDQMGAPFSDYGIIIYLENDDIQKCVLNMYDRNISIEYYK